MDTALTESQIKELINIANGGKPETVSSILLVRNMVNFNDVTMNFEISDYGRNFISTPPATETPTGDLIAAVFEALDPDYTRARKDTMLAALKNLATLSARLQGAEAENERLQKALMQGVPLLLANDIDLAARLTAAEADAVLRDRDANELRIKYALVAEENEKLRAFVKDVCSDKWGIGSVAYDYTDKYATDEHWMSVMKHLSKQYMIMRSVGNSAALVAGSEGVKP